MNNTNNWWMRDNTNTYSSNNNKNHSAYPHLSKVLVQSLYWFVDNFKMRWQANSFTKQWRSCLITVVIISINVIMITNFGPNHYNYCPKSLVFMDQMQQLHLRPLSKRLRSYIIIIMMAVIRSLRRFIPNLLVSNFLEMEDILISHYGKVKVIILIRTQWLMNRILKNV